MPPSRGFDVVAVTSRVGVIAWMGRRVSVGIGVGVIAWVGARVSVGVGVTAAGSGCRVEAAGGVGSGSAARAGNEGNRKERTRTRCSRRRSVAIG